MAFATPRYVTHILREHAHGQLQEPLANSTCGRHMYELLHGTQQLGRENNREKLANYLPQIKGVVGQQAPGGAPLPAFVPSAIDLPWSRKSSLPRSGRPV